MVGIPEMGKGKARADRVVLRVLPGERARWDAAAKRSGVTLSAWLRGLANAAAAPAKRKP